jgi:amino acid transporter
MNDHITEHKHGGIGELAATAISGNDITSSCLYVSALAITYAGIYAPLVLLIVAAVLFLFRSIYAEVVGALPLNGGAYNALLNTTSKFRASIAACLTILSYMATAVISASEAMHYAHNLWHGLPVMQATAGLLAVFMGLTILGISDSARVAIAIFLIHIGTLTLLVLVGGWYLLNHGVGVLTANLAVPTQTGVWTALFFGFAAALLGISGFESSANFVEEQAEGVFPKTLRNMWIAVTVFNPGMAILALALVPIADVEQHQEALLAHMGGLAAGDWLSTLVSVDAVLVLSGAVLTSFVGVNGLVRRMTLDRCLPQFLLKTNSRGTTHRILIAFFMLSVSVLLITQGDLKALAGVYTISFLGVMALFGLGNILLKVKRAQLPRPTRASWPGVLLAIAAVITGLVGNALLNPAYLAVFLEYFLPTLLIVSIMLGRIALLKMILFVVRAILSYFVRHMENATNVHPRKNRPDQCAADRLFYKGRQHRQAQQRDALCAAQ